MHYRFTDYLHIRPHSTLAYVFVVEFKLLFISHFCCIGGLPIAGQAGIDTEPVVVQL